MLGFRKFPVVKKCMEESGGGAEYQDFASEMFCLTLPKNSAGDSFSRSIIQGIEKIYG